MQACIFSYCVTCEDIEIEELDVVRKMGAYSVLTDSRTPWDSAESAERACAIYGYAVNVTTGERAGLAEKMHTACRTIQDIVAYEKQLGGKYVIFYRNAEGFFLLGDATCSVPVYYGVGLPGVMCASNPQYIVQRYGLVPDAQLNAIRSSGDISQAMPFDITPYSEMKQLLPNHYLSASEQRAVRFVNASSPQAEVTIQQAVEQTAPMIDVLTGYYLENFPIYCPITAGMDSRTVLAFLARKQDTVSCYTIRHPEHSGDAQDIRVPQKLCAMHGQPHRLVEDVTVSSAEKARVDELLGEGSYSQRTLRIAQTVNTWFGDGAILNGDIIGQVGKCSLHRDIPQWLATPGYFRCKLHNFSRGALTYLKLWLDEIAAGGEKVNTFDLFSIENRMGRWAGQTSLVYNTIGQLSLNIFNSRSIIYVWTAIQRSQRMNGLLHLALIEDQMPALLNIPFGNEQNLFHRISKRTWHLYYLASFIKYYSGAVLFQRKKKQ